MLISGLGFWYIKYTVGGAVPVFCMLLACPGGHVVFVHFRAQQCDLNPDLLRVLEDGYVSKCRDAQWCLITAPSGVLLDEFLSNHHQNYQRQLLFVMYKLFIFLVKM